jgi:hypothetical protein
MSMATIKRNSRKGQRAKLKKELDSLKISARSGDIFARGELARVAAVYCKLSKKKGKAENMSSKELTKKVNVRNYRPGTYTGRKTNQVGSNKIAPSQKDMVLEMKKSLLVGEAKNILFSSVVSFVMKNFHRTKKDAVFVLYNMAGLCYLKIEGEGEGKTISFLI